MAVKYSGDGFYYGLSTDTKPTAALGLRFYNTDTFDTEVCDGTFWWLSGPTFNPFSRKRWGSGPWGSGLGSGTGSLISLTAATGAGSQAFVNDPTNGRYVNCITGTTLANKGGYRVASNFNLRVWNSRMRIIFQFPASGDSTLARAFIGFHNSGDLTGDDPLNALSGVLVGFISGATNFKILHNDGTGAGVYTADVAGSAQALDTTIHTVSIVADEPNTRFGIKWDNNAYVFVSSDIPTTAGLCLCYQNETNESGVAKNLRVYNVFVQSDK